MTAADDRAEALRTVTELAGERSQIGAIANVLMQMMSSTRDLSKKLTELEAEVRRLKRKFG